MAKNIKLKDLSYGVLNTVEDSSYNRSFDRRRTDALTYLQTVISDYYTPDTLEKYDTFRGIVVKAPEAVPRVFLPDPQGKIDELATEKGIFGGVAVLIDFIAGSMTKVYKVYIPELEMRPAPTSINDPVIDTYYDVLLSENFQPGFIQKSPVLGQLVTVKFTDLNSFYDPRIISMGEIYNLAFDESKNSKDAHNNNVPSRRVGLPATVGSSTNVIDTSLLTDLQELSPGEYVTSDAPVSNNLTQIVEKELSFWSGKKEKVPDAYSRLKTYWDNLGWFQASEGKSPAWSPSGVPWSAAYISYVVTRVDPRFPKSAAHYAYSESAKKGTGNWSLWKTNGNSIETQIGDILVKKRTGKGASSTSTHGDVVYKIQDGYAYLSGGNLGDTAKGNIKLQVNGQGRYADYGSYQILLKKNGKVTQEGVA